MLRSTPAGRFPTGAGLLFGLGLGGFFDGMVFHQLLQWPHMLSSWYPPTTLRALSAGANADAAPTRALRPPAAAASPP